MNTTIPTLLVWALLLVGCVGAPAPAPAPPTPSCDTPASAADVKAQPAPIGMCLDH